jgi:hypothetical protein
MHDPSAARYFFCHLQKTAGASLVVRLRRYFGGRHVYPNYHDGNIFARAVSVPLLLQRWNERGDEIKLVTGHFPLCTQELLGGGFGTFTILREPVARTLSYLRHRRKLIPEDRTKPLEQIYEQKTRFHWLVHNHMVKMLSLTTDEMTQGVQTRVEFTPERLSRAKSRLQTVDVVGIQERFDDFCAVLEETFGFDLGPPVVFNQTEPFPVAESFRRRIALDNEMDIELYQFARTLAASPARTRRRPQAGPAARTDLGGSQV